MALNGSWLDRAAALILGPRPQAQVEPSVPLWRSTGWDPATMAATISDLEEGRPISVSRSTQPVLLSYARDHGHEDAAELLQFFQAQEAESVEQLFARLLLPRSGPGVGRLLWTYAVRNQHTKGRELLELAGYRFPRALLEEDDEQADLGPGEYLYLMVEEGTDPPICKIGRTTKHPAERERQLNSSTSQHRRIRLVRYWQVHDCRVAEEDVFRALSAYRVHERREFFAIHPAEASALIDRLLSV